MILITVGTEQFPFNRLMQWVDALVNQGFLRDEQEEIIVQYGSCTILPAGAKVYPLLPEAKFRSLLYKARLVIGHCGEGTINLLEDIATPYILVPRSHQYGEHVDNHQIELALALERTGVPIAWSPGDLVRFIVSPARSTLSNVPASSINNLCRMLEQRFGHNEVQEHLEVLSIMG
jgi:UDP-N-acetylglucosamine transferase subunit ALG13